MFRLTAILLFCLLPGLAPLAQEAAEDDAESARQEERDELEPAVPDEVLDEGSVRRA